MKLSIITALAVLMTGSAAAASTPQAASATQARASDEQLSAEIATKIANDQTLAADAVKVTVENGVVTLSGMVGKDADKARAEKLARVPGVVRVVNNLKSRQKATDAVKETSDAVVDATKAGAKKTAEVTKQAASKTKQAVSKSGEVITDGWITGRIKTKFLADDVLQSSVINVDTKDNTVTLKGAVPTEAARARAVALAKEVEGVSNVVDNLKVVTSKAP